MKLFPQNMVLPLKQQKKEFWIKKMILIPYEIYDFVRPRKVEKNKIRNAKYNQKIDRRKRTLRSPFKQSSEIVFVLVERLKKKDAPSKLFKASTENMPFSIEIELKMNPDFTYFKEIPFGENNKFTLDFSNKEFVQQLSFLKNQDHYSSLDCHLILKESKQFNYKDKKKKRK